MSLPIDPVRWWGAAGMLLIYALMCITILRGRIRKRRALSGGRSGDADWIVACASQTGTAEELATRTVDTLRLAGVGARLCMLSDLAPEMIRGAERMLFVVSTYGEGNPPDNAALFADRLMRSDVNLSGLHYGMLALGDSDYVNFCGFGKALDECLRERGAQALFDRIDVDRVDRAAIDLWRHHLSHLAGTSDLPDWNGPAFSEWRLVERRRLNAGSAGEPVFHLELEPPPGVAPEWESGDLVQVSVPDEPEHPREYSIASVPDDGRIHLLIRRHRREDGSTGAASGWLTTQAAIGSNVRLRLRAHRRFRLESNAERPMILIGNGTGIAGLRGHLKARARSGAGPNWLIFGERNAAYDFLYRQEIEAWKAQGVLQRVDLAFSRDQPARRYVQDCIAEHGDLVRDWLAQGAAIYVCGSLEGMASGVDAALEAITGREALDELGAAGRYRRDVY